jgi:hypothetical protein
MIRHSTTPGYMGALATGHIEPAVKPMVDDDALLIDNLMSAALTGDSKKVDDARMALRRRMNELREAACGVLASHELKEKNHG